MCRRRGRDALPYCRVIEVPTRQRRRILSGQPVGRLVVPKEPKVGETVQLAKDVELEVKGVRRHRTGGWWIFDFLVRDARVRLLRAAPTGGYTGSPAVALSREPEAVDEDSQRRLTAESRAVSAIANDLGADQAAAHNRRQGISVTDDLAQALKEAQQLGIDTSSIEFVTERQVARLRSRLSKVTSTVAATA